MFNYSNPVHLHTSIQFFNLLSYYNLTFDKKSIVNYNIFSKFFFSKCDDYS